MDDDFDDLEDNKFNVRSALDALGESMGHTGKKKGRPRKHNGASTSSSHRRGSQSYDDEEREEEDEEEEVDEPPKSAKRRKRGGSEDEEWDEEQEELTVAQRRERRARKKPTLYSEESVVSEQRRRQQTMTKRASGSTGRRKVAASHYNNRKESSSVTMQEIRDNFSKDDKEELERMRQQWRDIENPLQAKHRILPFLRRGLFEKSLALITPSPAAVDATPGTLPDGIRTIIGEIGCSAGFSVFLSSMQIEACLAIYDICDRLFVLSTNLPDNEKIAQALRFWWNSLSYATRRKWEVHARRLVYGPKRAKTHAQLDVYHRPCAGGSEIAIDGQVTAKRLADEARWEDLHARSLSFLDEVDATLDCPLCATDATLTEKVKLASVKELQEHFFHAHWQVHGYACQFCGEMYPTQDQLTSEHTTCEDWVAWNASRILTGKQKLKMAACRMLLCCADCGWHTALSSRGTREKEEERMDYLRTFFAHHHNEGLLAMLVYFPGVPSADMAVIRFPVMSMAGGNPVAPCAHCGPSVTFRHPREMYEHCMKEHRDKPLTCGDCSKLSATEYMLKQHQMSHVHDNSFLADYLSNSAKVNPPPTNLSYAPRCGWKNRADTEDFAFGGVTGGGGVHTMKRYDLVDTMDNLKDVKVRLIAARRKEGKKPMAGGYEDADEPLEESSMARKVREKLRKKYGRCEGISALDDHVWFRDSQARVFQEWMEEWESPQGRKQGGPPKELHIDPSSDIIRIETVEVELQLQDPEDMLSGFLLNDNVWYCLACDTIVKGKQAFEHLKMDDESKNTCAFDHVGLQEDPHSSFNMFQLHSASGSSSDCYVPCPHCPKKLCSLTGLRVHVMYAHGIYVKCKKVADEYLTPTVVLKFDIRSRLAKSIDARLAMLPSGLLPQKFPLVTDVSSLQDQTWALILSTRENTKAEDLANIKQLVDQDRTHAKMPPGTPRPVPAFLANRRRQQQQHMQAPRSTVIVQTPRLQQPLSYEQQMASMRSGLASSSGVQHPQHHLQQLQQARLMNNNMSPLARAGVPQPMVQQGRPGGHAAHRPMQMTRAVKLASAPSFGNDGRAYVKCQVCTHSVDYEANLLKAHLARCHLYTCGHCTAIFVYETEAKKHAKKCRGEKNQQYYHPDPRLPHIKARCPYAPACAALLPMVEMPMHLMDQHMNKLEFELPGGRLMTRITMIEDRPPVVGKEPEVERLRYKYYVPPLEIALQQGCHQCQVCGLILPDHSKLMVHLKLHPEFSYFCWLCPRPQSASLGTIENIIRHLKDTHLPKKDEPNTLYLQTCPLCTKNIAPRPLQHLMYECEHNNMCTLCRDLPMFESLSELKEHKEKCHYNSIRRFECSHCAAFFATTQDFMRHVCDPVNMKTVCACGMAFKTRKLFTQHFQATHVRGHSCTICYTRLPEGTKAYSHWQSHGVTHKPIGYRHMLMCAYGALNNEVKTLFTHVSNASMRIRQLQGLTVNGGSADSPLQLSDDDDIIELDSSAVQKERTQAAAAAARVPQQQLSPAAAAALLPPTAAAAGGRLDRTLPDDAIIADVLRIVVNQVIQKLEKEDAAKRPQKQPEPAAVAAAASSDDVMMDPADNGAPAVPAAAVIDDDDDDCVMIEDEQTTLTAHVREESMDTSTAVGGQNQPGYKDDDEEPAGTSQQPVVRQFTPDDDDDLCIVTEIENPGCTTAAATLSKQREKKHGCPKCSTRFITRKTLQEHLRSAHQFDAGETTITEELGCPTNTAIWLCKSCCLAFQSMDQKRAHSTQHGGQRAFGCETCSCVAYNGEVMAQHQRKLADKRITYICGECKFEFEHEMQLHEHSRDKHAAVLLYFCKACEVASTDGPYIYGHIVQNMCPQDFQRGPKSQEDAAKRIGVCPANQMHFQPTTMTDYKEAFARVPNKFVSPSLCSHRSLIVAGDKQVSCKECRCLENLQRHVAMISHEDDAIRKYEATITKVRTHPPLTAVRLEYEKRQRADEAARTQRQQADQMARYGMPMGGGMMHPGAMRYGGGGPQHQNMHMGYPMQPAPQLPPLRGNHPMQQHLFPVHSQMDAQQERADATRRFNDRVQAAQSAKMSVVGGGGRPPMLTPGSGTGAHAHNGGPAILRSAPSGPRPPPAPQPQRVHASHPPPYALGPHTPPVLTRAPLSTMGSLQSIAAMVGVPVGPPPGYGSHAAPVGGNCNHCNAPILSQRDSFIHSLHTSDRGAFVCSTCPVAIADERSAIKHIVNHMEPRERQLDMDMECPFEECGVEVPTLIMLKNHLIAHAPPLRHRVRSCHLTFGSAALARTHEEIHEKSKRDNECCILCGTMDNWEMEMTDRRGKGLTVKHVMKHAMAHKYYCKICDMQTFDLESQMVTHYIMHHTAAEGDIRTCSDCDEHLRTDQDHKVHCLTQHTITELYQPEKMMIRIPQEFSDHIGVGIDEPIPGRR